MQKHYQVFLGTTFNCNLNCKHCYVNKESANDVPLHGIEKIIKRLADYGVIKLVFTHGENLLRPDFEEIVKFSNKCGFYTTLLSNGTLLGKERVKSLFDKGLDQIHISLDSLDHQFHNEFRGVPFTWEKAVKGIENCVEIGIRTGINTTINKHNYKRLSNFVNFAIEKKVREIDFLIVRPFLGSSNECEFSKAEYVNIIRTVLKLKEKFKEDVVIGFHDPLGILEVIKTHGDSSNFEELVQENICQAGKLWFSILPNGKVQPCNFISTNLGNVYEDSFDSILSKLSQYVEEETCTPIDCQDCPAVNYCNGGCKAFQLDKTEKDFRCSYT